RRRREGVRFVSQVRFAPDGKSLYALHTQENAIIVWAVDSGKEVRRLPSPGGYLLGFDLSADGKTLTTAEYANNNNSWVHILDAATGRPRHQLAGHGDRINDLALSPDGTRLVTVANDQTARFWDAAAGKDLKPVQLPGSAAAVAFAPDGDT